MNRYSVIILDKSTLDQVATACVNAYGIKEAKVKAMIETNTLTRKKSLVLSCTKLAKR